MSEKQMRAVIEACGGMEKFLELCEREELDIRSCFDITNAAYNAIWPGRLDASDLKENE